MRRDTRRAGHPIFYYLRNFRFHSVLFRYYVLVFLFFYLPFVLAVVGVTTHYSNTVREHLHAAYDASVRQAGQVMTNALRRTEIALFQLSRNESVGDFVETQELARPGYDALLMHDNATRELQQHGGLATFYLASHVNGYFISSSGIRSPLETDRAPPGLDAPRHDTADWLEWHYGAGEIRMSRPVWRPRSGPLAGVVLAEIHTADLLRSMHDVNVSGPAGVYLLSPEGAIIDAYAPGAPLSLVTAESVPRFRDSVNGEFVVVPRDGSDYAVFARSGHRGIVYLVAVPTELFISSIRATNRAVFLITAVLAVLTIPLVFAIAVHLYNPVKQLFEIAEQTELAARGEAVDPGSYDEIRFITDNMTRSLNRQRELETELDRRVSMLNRAQVLALQSQISPHFLNNTLSTINWLAMDLTGGENEVTRVVNDLSGLLRATMESDRMLTTLGDELAHARTYVEIQRVRYRGMLDVRWDIPEELLGVQIVRITLQPLIENAIYHGVKPRRKGTIAIRAESGRKTLTVAVVDDGVGIDPGKAETLNRAFEEEYATTSEHIGLANVNQRTKLVFGEEYGLHVERAVPCGTRVTMTLPRASQPHLELQKPAENPTHR